MMQFFYGIMKTHVKDLISFVQMSDDPSSLFLGGNVRTACELYGIPYLQGDVLEVSKVLSKKNIA
jgi:hypothetical protein